MDAIEQVKSKLAEITSDLGFELVDLSGVKLGGHTVIRAYIHKPGGVTIDECAIVSRAYSDYLDLEDPIQGNYRLEVSSLGLDRPLKEPADYRRRIGEKVKLELEPGSNSRGVVTGTLIGFDDSGVTLEIEEKQEHFTYNRILRGKIIY